MRTNHDINPADWGATLLRVALGIMFLAHSVVLKLMTYGLPGTAKFFEGAGLPGWLAYVTFICEAAGGVGLVVGVQARWVALALSPFLLGALFAVHLPNGWVFTGTGGGWEYPAYLFVLCIAQALVGDGAMALMKSGSLGDLLRSGAALRTAR
jgi:putative oxidoreductase